MEPAGRGAGCRQQPASSAPRPGKERGHRVHLNVGTGRVWPFFGLPLFGFHGNVCLWETPSLLATDRHFWSLSLIWLRR